MKYLCFFFLFIINKNLSGQNKSYEQLRSIYFFLLNNDKLDSALIVAKKMNRLALHIKKDSSLEFAVSLRYIGTGFGISDSALFYYKQSLLVLEKQGRTEHPDYAAGLNIFGLLFLRYQNYKKAEPYLLRVSEIMYATLGNKNADYATSLSNLGNLYFQLNDFKSSEMYYNKALECNKLAVGEEHIDYANNLYNLGRLYSENGKYLESIDFYKNALKIFRKLLLEKNIIYANILNNLGNVYSYLGERILAKQYLESALKLKEVLEGNNSLEYASTLNDLGTLYLGTENYMEAEKYCQRAYEIKKTLLGVNHLELGFVTNTLGILNQNIGNYFAAEKYLRKTLEIRQSNLANDHPDYASSLNNLGCFFLITEKYKAADSLINMALFIRKKILNENHPDIADSFNSLGALYATIGENKAAEDNYKQATEIYKAAFGEKNKSYAICLNNLGVLYSKIGDFNKAEELQKNASKISKVTVGEMNSFYLESLENLGILNYKRKEYQAAEPYFRQVLNGRLSLLKHNFNWLSTNQKIKYWNQNNSFWNILTSFGAHGTTRVPSLTESIYSACLFSKALLLETSRELDRAINNSTNFELRNQFADLREYRRICYKFQSEGNLDKDILNNYMAKADSLDKILVNKLGAFAAAKRKFEITWKDVQAKLSKDEAAIEFARYYEDADSSYKYLALVLRSGYANPAQVLLGSEDQIEVATQNRDFGQLYQLVWKGVDSLLPGVHKVYYSPAGVLNNVAFSALCIQGGEKENSPVNNLLVTRGEVPGSSSKNMKFCQSVLMDRYELHQLSTTRYLADGSLEKGLPLRKEVALIGGVNYDVIPKTGSGAKNEESEADFAFHINLKAETREIDKSKRSGNGFGLPMPYLAGTNEEVQSISNLLKPSWKIQTRSGEFATEKHFKASLSSSRPGVLHIATHGFAFPEPEKKRESMTMMMMMEKPTYKVSEDPMVRCGLMLSGANISWTGNPQKMIEKTGEDGILTAAEVAGMDLSDTKLVVLSACETGKGKIEGSEGTMGLKRGFKLAGVEQLIVSLWAVPDKETSELMTLFYADLARTMNPVSSFERAQKEMRKRYPADPEKWAGFVLIR